MAFYLDTSAAVKLVVLEAESSAMTAWLQAHDGQLVSSDLLRTELLRVIRRAAPEQMQRARAVLDSITLLTLPPATFERAAELDPDGLRSLGALHLAAALELGDELDGVVTYDERLARAAQLRGVGVIAPT
ncbi:MAG TPA: type II toxin-antitoxin system VapC family toxin [Candidatus Nanopelagicaceae bacterium]|nr:type II toxin-antitoxin system VapC family toxin [Candidatus Nanopelagicaceae bacterium]